MRIRLFTAFASNNSGAYTIVGSFADAAAAAEVAALLARVTDAHDAWYRANPYDDKTAAPLDEFVKSHGLRDARHGRGDDWPAYGEKPTVLAVDTRVIVHAPYTVTLPRLFGELFYAKGGRVEVELNHTHDDLAVEFSWYPDGINYGDPARELALDAFEELLRPELPALIARPDYDERPPVAPAWHRGGWGLRSLSVVFGDLVAGVAAVRAVADAGGMKLVLRIVECPHGIEDPFAVLRAERPSAGVHRVIVWSVGSDRIAAMKALRAVAKCGLDEAKAMVEGLPKELLLDVAERYAEEAAVTLRAAGCDVEVVAPKR